MKKQLQPQQETKPRIDSAVFQAISVMIIGLLISISILIVSGAASEIYDDIYDAIPKFPKYEQLKSLDTFDSVNTVFAAQPKLSYTTNAKFLFVENSDMNCINCAKFNGYNAKDNNYSSYKLKKDFIEKGKMDYMFVDTLVFDSVEKHNAAYCVAEQNIGGYFEFKQQVYKNYGKDFNLNVAKGYIKGFNIDQGKYDECYNSQKYKDRINNLSSFSNTQLSTSSTPTFHLFKVEEKEVTKSDGSKVKEKSYTLVKTMVGNQDYDLFIKPELEKLIK